MTANEGRGEKGSKEYCRAPGKDQVNFLVTTK